MRNYNVLDIRYVIDFYMISKWYKRVRVNCKGVIEDIIEDNIKDNIKDNKRNKGNIINYICE